MDSEDRTPLLGEPADEQAPATISRRRFVLRTLGWFASVGVASAVGYEWPRPQVAASPASNGALEAVRDFVSRPDLHPPRIRFTITTAGLEVLGREALQGGDQPRYIFVSPRTTGEDPSQPGLMVLDRQGRLIWFEPKLTSSPFDMNVQTYQGQPHLTWWEGDVVHGHGEGVAKIANESYREVNTIRAGHGLQVDLHELRLTNAGTALITAYENTTADLTSVGGAKGGALLAGHVQEIDLATGEVLFDWNSIEHVGVDESYQKAPTKATIAYDYFHINSIAEDFDGNLLVGARNTWAVYKIHRQTGEVMWRMNGKRSDFSMGPGAAFYWQHDATMPEPSLMSVFDDGGYPNEEKQSRALLLHVDTQAMTVTLKKAFEHPAGFVAANQGNVELLADGRVFVGWGNQPYFTEFAADGTLLFDGEFPSPVRSYRAYTHQWEGTPLEAPSVAARSNNAGGSIVYASWNGSTEVRHWMVRAGKERSALAPVGSQEWTGFETAIAVNTPGRYFSVTALDKDQKELATSAIVEIA